MTDPIVMVKATPLLSVLAFMDENLAADAKESVLNGVAPEFPEEVRKVRERRIIASERFPVAFLNRLIEASAKSLNRSALEVSHRIGRMGAENASSGILKLALAMISMPSLLRKLEPVWSQLYTHGRTTNECRDKSATVELHDFPYVSATQCARVTGMFEWFAQKAERTAAVRHVSCRASRDPVCRWDISW
ncbi:MAG TPA: hypothetical protein VFM36_16100 [Thermoanaerobaculia bacterium]|nr:hypothetical protein [Thermoanaerobaculia bacterium]